MKLSSTARRLRDGIGDRVRSQDEPLQASENVIDDSDLGWYYPTSSIASEYNFKPISITEALRSELIMSAKILLAKSAQEPDYITVNDDGTAIAESRGYRMFQDLLDHPNPVFKNFLDLAAWTIASLATMGKTYWIRGSHEGMETTSVWPVSREHMQVQYGEDGLPEKYHVYTKGMSATQRRHLESLRGAGPYEPEEVIEFNLLKSELGAHREHGDSSDAIYPLDSLLGVLTIDEKMTARTSSLMSLGAGTVVSPDGEADTQAMGKEALDANMEFVQSRMKELTQMAADGQPVVFPVPVKVEQIGFPPNQMFPKGMSNRPEGRLSSVYGIPLGLMGYELSTEGGQSYASLAIQRQFFAETTQLPLLKYFCHVVTTEVLHEFVLGAKFMVIEDTIRALQKDETEKFKAAVMLYTSGIYTLNQVLEYLGKLPIGENGERYFVPANATLIRADGSAFIAQEAMPNPTMQNLLLKGNGASPSPEADILAAIEYN